MFGEQDSENSFNDYPDRVFDFFRSLSKHIQNLVVVVENVDWCDPASKKLIEQLLDLKDRVVVIATTVDEGFFNRSNWVKQQARLSDVPGSNLPSFSRTQRLVLNSMAVLGSGTCISWIQYSVPKIVKSFLAFRKESSDVDESLEEEFQQFSQKDFDVDKRIKEDLEDLVDCGAIRVTPILSTSETHGRSNLDGYDGPDAVVRFTTQELNSVCLWEIEEYSVSKEGRSFEGLIERMFLRGILEFLAEHGDDVTKIRFKYSVSRVTKNWRPDRQLANDGLSRRPRLARRIRVMLHLRYLVACRASNISFDLYVKRLLVVVDLLKLIPLKSFGAFLHEPSDFGLVKTAIVEVLSVSEVNGEEAKNAFAMIDIANEVLNTIQKRQFDGIDSLDLSDTRKEFMRNVSQVYSWKEYVFPLKRAQWSFFQRMGKFEIAYRIAKELEGEADELGLRTAEILLELNHLLAVSLFSLVEGSEQVDQHNELLHVSQEGNFICSVIDDNTFFKAPHFDYLGSHCPGGCCMIIEAIARARGNLEDAEEMNKLAEKAFRHVLALDHQDSIAVVLGYYAYYLAEFESVEHGLDVAREGIIRLNKAATGKPDSIEEYRTTRWLSFVVFIMLSLEVLRQKQNPSMQRMIQSYQAAFPNEDVSVEEIDYQRFVSRLSELRTSIRKYSKEFGRLFDLVLVVAKGEKRTQKQLDKYIANAAPMRPIANLFAEHVEIVKIIPSEESTPRPKGGGSKESSNQRSLRKID